MKRNGKTDKAIREAVVAARTGRHVRFITSKRDAKALHEGGTRAGRYWRFGSGLVKVVS